MSCRDDVPPRRSYCDGDRRENCWVEGADADGVGGVCLLDTLTTDMVIRIVERDDHARRDLIRVTTDPDILRIATETPRLTTRSETDAIQAANPPAIPFYSVFRGILPFNQ